MEMKTAYQENGDEEALDSARVLIEETSRIKFRRQREIIRLFRRWRQNDSS